MASKSKLLNSTAVSAEFIALGAEYGAADKARYKAAVRFGELVKEGFYVVDDAIKAVKLFQQGASERSGRPMPAELSMNNMATQWKAFATEAAVERAAELREKLEPFMAGKARKDVGKDFFQMAYAVNVQLKDKPKAAFSDTFFAERAKPKANPNAKPAGNGAAAEPATIDYVQQLRDAAEHLMAEIKGKGAKARKDALALVIDLFPVAA